MAVRSTRPTGTVSTDLLIRLAPSERFVRVRAGGHERHLSVKDGPRNARVAGAFCRLLLPGEHSSGGVPLISARTLSTPQWTFVSGRRDTQMGTNCLWIPPEDPLFSGVFVVVMNCWRRFGEI